MTKKLRSWNEKAKKSEIGNYDFAVEDVIKGKVDGNYFYFKDKDKKSLAQQQKAGFKSKPTQSVIRSTPVYTGQKVWDDRLGKYVPANASQLYRTR